MVAVDYALNLINDLYANGYSYIDSYLKLKKEIEDKMNEQNQTIGYLTIDLNEEKKAIKAEKVQERFNIILTKDNELKKVSAGKLKFDDNTSKVIEVGEKDRFVLISNTGTMYKLNAKDIKLVSQGSKGQNIKEFFNDEERKIIKEAIEDHRASSNHEPRNIYGNQVCWQQGYI